MTAMVRSVFSVDEKWQSERAQVGDLAAFETLMRQFERPLYGYIYRMLRGSPEDAADVLQESFLKLFRALERVPADASIGAWLFRIARNCCIDELRRRKRGQWITWDGGRGTPMIAVPWEIDPESAFLRREGESIVLSVMERMSVRNREALILRECAGLSCEEIGVVFGISRKAVKSMLFRARDEFRRMMQNPMQ
jgi:RNA polymerase sigma-70 factor (ECF subfamily)